MNPNNPQTPGVYTVEKSAFPPSVAQVPTAIPAFVGYTEKAEDQGKSLINKPTLITSLSEYNDHFGGAPDYKFPIEQMNIAEGTKPKPDDYDFSISSNFYKLGLPTIETRFYLYNCLRLFYLNGGGQAYIVSVGTYKTQEPNSGAASAATKPNSVSKSVLESGLATLPLIQSPKPTMILIPDAMALESADDCYSLQQQMIAQAGSLRDRIALLDIYEGYKDLDSAVIENFRNNIGPDHLSYAVAYYPWLQTEVVSASELKHTNLASSPSIDTPNTQQASVSFLSQHNIKADKDDKTYQAILAAMLKQVNKLPPASAMAGVYTTTDNSTGVWTAPANCNIDAVVAPLVSINDDQQAPLNVDALAGKSINAIRSFYGRGPAIVWGARTMDGNSLDWRYVNVRRLIIMIEQSVANVAFSLVFKPNDSSTWAMAESMISNFLHNLWAEGALQGSSSADAYNVMVGLGKTMKPIDILNGIMRIQVKLAVVHPAEFIIITYEQEMPIS